MNTERFRAEIDLNARQAQSELKKLEEQQKRLKDQQKALYESSSAKNHQLAADMQKDIDNVSTKIREQKKYINGLSTAVSDLSNASYKELSQTVKVLNKQLRSGDIPKGSKEFKAMAERIKDARREMQKFNDATKEQQSFLSRAADKLNKYQTAIGAAVGSIAGITMTVRKSVQDYAEMDDAMVDVQKYTGMTKDQVKQLNEEFKKMDTRTSREQLNSLADDAGRLGITSQKGAKEFVEAADKINVALGDDLGDGAVDQIGKMAMAFGEDDKHGLNAAMLKTGSVVNELSQSSSASGGYLVEFASRVAGVAQQVGMTIPQIMSFGSVLDQNMQEVEVSATSLNQLITAMFKEPAKFAQLAGMDVQKFTKILKTDANQALLEFLATMKNSGGFDKLAPMFDQMGLSGSRAVQVLSTLAGHLKDVTTAENIANKAYDEGTSVVDEYNRANSSAQAELEKAQKKFHDLSAELGEQLQPVVKYTITSAGALTKALIVIVPWLRKNILYIGELAAIIGVYTLATKAAVNWAKIKAAWQARLTLMDKAEVLWTKTKTAALALYTLAVGVLKKDTVALTVAQTELNAVTKANPWGLLASALATVAIGIIDLIGYFSKLGDKEKEVAKQTNVYIQRKQALAEVNKEANEQAAESITKLKSLRKTLEDNNAKLADRKKALAEIKKMVPEYHGALTSEGRLINNNANVLVSYCNNLIAAARAQAAFNKMVGIQSNTMGHQDLLNARASNNIWARQQMAKEGYNEDSDQMFGSRLNGSYYIRRKNGNGTYTDIQITKERYDRINHLKAIIAYNNKRIQQETTIIKNNNKISESLQEQVKVNSKAAGKVKTDIGGGGSSTVHEPKGGTSTYVDPKTTKAQKTAAAKAQREAAAAEKKRQAEAKKALKEKVDAAKAEYSEENAAAMESYSKGLINYSDFVDKQHDITDKYYDKLKDIYGKDSAEYKKLLDDRAKEDQDYQEKRNDISKQDIETDHLQREAKLREQYYNDASSAIYQNEKALDEALFQEKMQYLSDQQSLYTEGTKEWHSLEMQKQREQSEHQLQLQEDYVKQLNEYRKEMNTMSIDEQEKAEKAGVEAMYESLKATGMMTKEEYDKIIAHIEQKYKELKFEHTADQEVKDKASADLEKAKKAAGVSDISPSGENAVVGISSAIQAISQQKMVVEKLKALYGEDYENNKYYQEAKKQLGEDLKDKLLAAAQATYSGINNFLFAASSYSQACSDLETAKITANYQKQIDAASNNSSRKEALEKKRDKEIAKAKTKSNKKAMKLEIAQAFASTALAAINSYESASKVAWWLGPIAAAMATAAGMVQIATIKKQHQAEAAGYYEGGYTGGNRYRREAGVVHEGEFVANHQAVNNRNLQPVFSLIDEAQKNNRVASLTAEDVTRQLGSSANVQVAAPVVNLQTDNSDLKDTLEQTRDTLSQVGAAIDNGIKVDWESFDRGQRHWNNLKGNK